MTLYNQVRRNVRRNETYIRAFEAPYVVRMHNKYILSGKLTIYEMEYKYQISAKEVEENIVIVVNVNYLRFPFTVVSKDNFP